MLSLQQQWFGKYPFAKDGFTIMESLYPMEHQGAVSIGAFSNPFNSEQFDIKELQRLAWHESAHEWWGNNISCGDIAGIWIHEAFATYCEVLCYEAFQGKEAAREYLRHQRPSNKTPVIGTYGVNDFRLGDVYAKGVLMLNTFRHVLNNDTTWFGLLKAMQAYFKHKIVSTEDIIDYINLKTGTNYTAFFQQYLNHASIPELQIKIKPNKSGIRVDYRWKADVKDFHMPVEVYTQPGSYARIYPTTQWKTLLFPGKKAADFKVNTTDFYINVQYQ